MIVLKFKLKGKDLQYQRIDEAIRTAQFVRNKALRYWMDNRGVGRYDLNKYCAELAQEFPFAKALNSMARQAAAERAWSAIARFYDNCKKQVKGKKGFPKFKKHCRSVEYKTSGWKLHDPKHIEFTDGNNIGVLKLVGTWDLAFYDPAQIKRVRLVKRADGYYCQFCISVKVEVPSEPTHKTVGIDLGLNYFIATSDGETVESPKFYRKAEHQLNRANRQKSKKYRKGAKPQSRNYHRARERYARKHLKVSRQRKEYCKRVAYCVIQSNDLVAYEDLNVKNMVRNRHLAKSISDAGWTTFCQWLDYFGRKYGKVTVAVPPHYTSQNCSQCGATVKKSLSIRTHVCSNCGYVEDRDVNAARNILRRGLEQIGRGAAESTLQEFDPLASLEQSCGVKVGR
ncbi:transposase [Synechocystis sp. LKSZ1]|uniref:RNA-guided endonuclease InsQ/TnpB family protein n=1 Tax=Synechocystis sp. LKSZ1 TaxID=3144951 RepID=UPI00336BF577